MADPLTYANSDEYVLVNPNDPKVGHLIYDAPMVDAETKQFIRDPETGKIKVYRMVIWGTKGLTQAQVEALITQKNATLVTRINNLDSTLTNFLDADDTTLDQLSELVVAIKANKTDIASLVTAIGKLIDPVSHLPIKATATTVGVVQLATAQDITNGTAGKVVDAQELINFAQTLPAANGVTDVSSGDNSNQIVVSKFDGNKTLTIDNVAHASNADEATHAARADTATSANSVAWDNVSGKPSTFTPSDHAHSRYGLFFDDVCPDTNTGWYESNYKYAGDDNQIHLYINDYFGIHFHTMGSFDVNGHAIISEGNIGSQSVNYANSAGNADTVDGSHAWQMQTLSADGNIYGSGAWLLQCQHNVDGDDYFKLYCGDKSHGIKVDRASSAGWADSAGNANDPNAVHKSGDETIDGVKTFNANIESIGSCQLKFRHIDGSTNGFEGDLYLNYHNNSQNVYFNGASYYINGGYYNGTAERANSAGWADASGRVRTQSNSEWFINCNWDGSYFQTNCVTDDGNQLPVNVQKANYADSAGSVAWGNVSGRPDIWIG